MKKNLVKATYMLTPERHKKTEFKCKLLETTFFLAVFYFKIVEYLQSVILPRIASVLLKSSWTVYFLFCGIKLLF